MYVNAPGCNPNAVTGDIDNYIMTQCFAFQAPGVLGNLGRHTLRMPVFRDLDFSVFKNQNLMGEKLKAQFRVEMFNIFNHVNLAQPSARVGSSLGQIGSTLGASSGQPGIGPGEPFNMQLALKLVY